MNRNRERLLRFLNGNLDEHLEELKIKIKKLLESEEDTCFISEIITGRRYNIVIEIIDKLK